MAWKKMTADVKGGMDSKGELELGSMLGGDWKKNYEVPFSTGTLHTHRGLFKTTFSANLMLDAPTAYAVTKSMMAIQKAFEDSVNSGVQQSLYLTKRVTENGQTQIHAVKIQPVSEAVEVVDKETKETRVESRDKFMITPVKTQRLLDAEKKGFEVGQVKVKRSLDAGLQSERHEWAQDMHSQFGLHYMYTPAHVSNSSGSKVKCLESVCVDPRQVELPELVSTLISSSNNSLKLTQKVEKSDSVVGFVSITYRGGLSGSLDVKGYVSNKKADNAYYIPHITSTLLYLSDIKPDAAKQMGFEKQYDRETPRRIGNAAGTALGAVASVVVVPTAAAVGAVRGQIRDYRQKKAQEERDINSALYTALSLEKRSTDATSPVCSIGADAKCLLEQQRKEKKPSLRERISNTLHGKQATPQKE